MAYKYRRNQPTDGDTRTGMETIAYIQKIKNLDRRFIAAMETREYMGPVAPTPFRPRGERAECGTHSGYKTHITNRTEPCQPCREARAIYQREYRASKKAA